MWQGEEWDGRGEKFYGEANPEETLKASGAIAEAVSVQGTFGHQ